MKTYTAKLKQRRRINREIPRNMQGWWADICPGKILQLRDATEDDIARCILNEGRSREPADYLCELNQNGWLVAKFAVSKLTPNAKLTGRGPQDKSSKSAASERSG